MNRRLRVAAFCFLTLSVRIQALAQRQFRIEEATIADIHSAMKAGNLTCHALVQQYLDRIDAYDKRGPAVNAIITVNPRPLPVPTSSMPSLQCAVSAGLSTASRLS